MSITLVDKVKEIVSTLITEIPNCSPISVGGSVRDALMHSPGQIMYGFEHYTKDFDLEIFHAEPGLVTEVLFKAGIFVELVGRSFPVFKVKGFDIDISFPRTENKTGEKHTDFSVVVDPNLTFEKACLRRDFTVNAIGYDWKTGKILDPYGGRHHIDKLVLAPVSDKYMEDALRVLRAFKFIARYGFQPTQYCVDLSKLMVPELANYSRERVMGEWNDFILKGKPGNIHDALAFLWETGAIHLYPELEGIHGVRQSPVYHPEGDVLTHTKHCLGAFMGYIRERIIDDENKLIVGYSVLTHDFGKAECTVFEEGRIHSHGHEGSELARKFMERIFDPADNRVEHIMRLVKAHMRPVVLYNDKAKPSAIRRLLIAVDGEIANLASLVLCDLMGRPPIKPELEVVAWLLDQHESLRLPNCNKIEPIILGRHLIEHLGMKPGPAFKPILEALFESQIEGEFTTEVEGIALLKVRYGKVS